MLLALFTTPLPREISALLVAAGSLANLIVAERASVEGVRLSFRDHARAGVPITLASMLIAGLWLWAMRLMFW